MNNRIFRGTGTAIVTPFHEDGSIDADSFKKLMEYQIEGGIEAVIVCGSTGESATLTKDEKTKMFRLAVEIADKRIPIIAGSGSNNTNASIEMTKIAKEEGADAVLLVAPYYNKPGQKGFYKHFRTIAEAVDIPQIVYNVPGRAASNISAETQLRLAEDCENIVATKEASGDLEQMMEIMKNAPEGFSLYSGDDALTLPIIASGGDGVISVISNYAPKDFSDMVRAALAKDIQSASDLHYKLFDLMRLNFIESNPVPVKAVLSMIGIIGDTLRLPLVPLSDKNMELIKDALRNAGYL